MNGADLCYLSAVDLRRLYLERALSPVEVTRATLERIERLNPTLNAFITVTADLALDQAREAEEAYVTRTGTERPLLGVPYSLKDLTATRGIRTTKGSLLWQDWVPDFDAPIAERSAAAGGVLLGKTNTPELGWKGDSGNRLIGPTHNPWRHGRTAGGSSGGAGAAVAAGLGPLAQGTDGAGSIRIPAAFCGIAGLKPSYGLVPNYPPSSVEALAHVGPMARTVRDLALYLSVLAGPDPRDRLSLNATGVDYLAACEGDVRSLRVAWCPTLGYNAAEPHVLRLVEEGVQALRDLGCQVEEVNPGWPDPFPIVDAIWASAMAAVHLDDLEAVRDQIDPGRLAVVEAGLRLRGVDVAWAYQQRAEFADRVRRFMEGYDLLITPTLPVTAFEAGADQPPEVAGKPTTYLGWTSYTYPFNLTGQPAATVPVGRSSDGLPVGMQIVGRWRDDATVLRAAAAFEVSHPWGGERPPLD